jgi:hypothetical protein
MRHQTTRQCLVFVRCGLAVAALSVLVACGARSSAATVAAAPAASTTAATTTSDAVTATRSGTSRSATGVAIDRRIARDAQLLQSDFPAGWTSSPAPGPTMGAGCPGLTGAKAAVSARATSREFVFDSVVTADGGAYVYADTATAVHWFARLTSPHTTACLVRALRHSLGLQAAAQGATINSITARRLIIEPVGDEHSAHLVTVRLSDRAVKATAYADVIFVRVDRAVAGFSLGRVGRIFDPALETKLATAVAGRLASGLAAS